MPTRFRVFLQEVFPLAQAGEAYARAKGGGTRSKDVTRGESLRLVREGIKGGPLGMTGKGGGRRDSARGATWFRRVGPPFR